MIENDTTKNITKIDNINLFIERQRFYNSGPGNGVTTNMRQAQPV
jgi:hypothetical protein